MHLMSALEWHCHKRWEERNILFSILAGRKLFPWKEVTYLVIEKEE